MGESTGRTGLLMARIWVESDRHYPFRMRITLTQDASGPEQTTITGATPEALYAAVRAWVETFVKRN